MANPFERPDGEYLVLRNQEGQYSLWPGIAAVPAGWAVVHGPDDRAACTALIRESWTDMRPLSLVAGGHTG